MDKQTTMKFALLPGEKIEWVGKPNSILKTEKEPLWLKLIFYLIAVIEFSRYFILLFCLIYVALTKGLSLKDIVVIPLLLLIYLIIAYITNKTNSSIEFCLTDQRVIFNSWKFYTGKESNFIYVNQIERLSLVNFKNGVGTIYFHGSKIGSFKNTEHHLALIDIENSKIVYNKLSEMIKGPNSK